MGQPQLALITPNRVKASMVISWTSRSRALYGTERYIHCFQCTVALVLQMTAHWAMRHTARDEITERKSHGALYNICKQIFPELKLNGMDEVLGNMEQAAIK